MNLPPGLTQIFAFCAGHDMRTNIKKIELEIQSTDKYTQESGIILEIPDPFRLLSSIGIRRIGFVRDERSCCSRAPQSAAKYDNARAAPA
jgi:hypothetical protein